jgi:hypothetical protein
VINNANETTYGTETNYGDSINNAYMYVGNYLYVQNQLYATMMFDADDDTFFVDPNSNSRLNNVALNELEANRLRLVTNVTIGGSCITKSIGTTNIGEFASCVSGLWVAPGEDGGSEHPIGFIYMSSVLTNPATLLGYGTWVSFGDGRVPVGRHPWAREFNTMEETGGSKTTTLTLADIPRHQHPGTWGDRWGGPYGQSGGRGHTGANSGDRDNYQWNTGYTGGGAPHNNLQPYIVVKMWKRTL